MKNIDKVLVRCFLLFFITVVQGQSKDFLSWNSLELGYEPSKNWDFTLLGQLRLKNDVSTIDEYFGQFQVNRRLAKGLKLGVGFRYTFEKDDQGKVQGIENHFRYHIDLRYRNKLNDFTLRYRIRYQNKNELGVDDEANKFLRFKAGVEYNIKGWKLDPKLDGELFNRLQSNEERTDRFRITLGTGYKIKKAGEISGFYRVQSSFNDVARETRFIFGLKYSYTIK